VIKSHQSLFILENLMKKFFLLVFFILLFCVITFAQESKPLIILDQPLPGMPKIEGTVHVQGTISLRVEFLANGEIGQIVPISTLPYGFTDQAIAAAKRIKFKSAIENGEAKTVTRTVSYSFDGSSWTKVSETKSSNAIDEKAEAIVKKAVENLGGEKYLQVKSLIGRGKFHQIRDGIPLTYQTFIDVIIEDNERTEFKSGGIKNIQTNSGDRGWVFDGAADVLKDQTESQIENFKRGIRVSLDHLLRGSWRGKATLSYVGKREAGLAKRNEVVKLVFDDGLTVEFEFSSSDGMPEKALYKYKTPDGDELREEDRYAQFVDIQGVKAPFIIDHYINNTHTSRINYESMEYNKNIPDSIFAKPSGIKELKKDLKL